MIPPRPPIKWIAGSVVYGPDGFTDPWTVLRVEMSSYDGLTRKDKVDVIDQIRAFGYHVGHDFQLLRVGTWFDRSHYITARRRAHTEHPELRDAYLAEQSEELFGLVPGEPRLFLAISHRSPQKSRREQASDPLSLWRDFRTATQRTTESVLSTERRDEDQRESERLYNQTAAYLTCSPASSEDLQWLIRRSWNRGGADPIVDALDEMQAPVVVDRTGREVLVPQEADLLRWTGGVSVGIRDLEVHGEAETRFQAAMVVARLPMADEAPSDMLELALRPSSRLDFPIDMSISCEWISNRRALEMTETAITDADEDAFAEADTERGATDEAAERPELAREQRAYLKHDRAPLLRSTIVVHVAGDTKDELGERAARVRQVFEDNDCQIQRPPMQQLQAFWDGLPAQRTNLVGYNRLMTCEQLGAQVWNAKHSVGSNNGWLLGSTMTASAFPVLFNPRDGSRLNRATAIALFGNLGTGKTALAQKIMYQAALDGARVIDQDPKGDHRWYELLPADSVEVVTLAPEPHMRGLLDPWRAAHADMRITAAVTFLKALLPAGVDPVWETTLFKAVHLVDERESNPTNVAVIRALNEVGGAVGREMAEHLNVHATKGLTQLGFANPDVESGFGDKQVTYVKTARLPLPNAKTPRKDYQFGEIVGTELSRLLAQHSMRIMEEHRANLKIYNNEEAWQMLKTQDGRAVFDSQQRMGRSELVVPMLATQTTTGIGQSDEDQNAIGNLFGAYFALRPADQDEAQRTLRLMGLDPSDESMIKRLLRLQSGQALFKDYRGNVEFVDIHLNPSFLEHTSTTPAVEAEGAFS